MPWHASDGTDDEGKREGLGAEPDGGAQSFSDLPLGAKAMTVGRYIGLGLAAVAVGAGMVSTVAVVPPRTGAVIHESARLDERGVLDLSPSERYVQNDTDGRRLVLRLPVPFSSYEEVSLSERTLDISIPVGQLATFTGLKADAAKDVTIHGTVRYRVEDLARYDARTDYIKVIEAFQDARRAQGDLPLSEQEKDAIFLQYSTREKALASSLEYVGGQVVTYMLGERLAPIQKQYQDEATIAALGGQESLAKFERERVPYFKGELKKAASQFYADISKDPSPVVAGFEEVLHQRGQGQDMKLQPSFEDVYGVRIGDIDEGAYRVELKEGG